MSYIKRSYDKSGYNTNMYYGGNCGCSDCLNKGGNKMLPNPFTEDGLYNTEAHILPYPYQNKPMCKCPACLEGGNIFDELANFMPTALKYVPIFGDLLSSGAELTLDALEPYRKNPRHPKEPEAEPYQKPAYQPMNTAYSSEQQDIVKRLQGRGKKKVRFNVPKKGSAEMKAKMAYLRSLKK